MVRMLLRRRGDKLRAVVDDCIDVARQQLGLAAAAQGHTLNDYATTLVGIVARGTRGVIFHIGDGAAVAFAADGSVRCASTTRDQEYANETYFVTDEPWREHLRFTAATGFRCLALMTDGMTPFAIGSEGPKAEFFEPVLRYLQAHPPGSAVLGLQRMLDRDEAQAQVGDDKTILWAFASSFEA